MVRLGLHQYYQHDIDISHILLIELIFFLPISILGSLLFWDKSQKIRDRLKALIYQYWLIIRYWPICILVHPWVKSCFTFHLLWTLIYYIDFNLQLIPLPMLLLLKMKNPEAFKLYCNWNFRKIKGYTIKEMHLIIVICISNKHKQLFLQDFFSKITWVLCFEKHWPEDIVLVTTIILPLSEYNFTPWHF